MRDVSVSPGTWYNNNIHIARGSLQRLRDTTGTTAAAFEAMAMSPDEGGRMLVDIITASKRETHGGEFIDLDGSKLPW